MKSFKKGILALGLTLGIIASVGGAAFAGSFSHGFIKNFIITANSSINSDKASAYTLYDDVGVAEVSSAYYYVNPTTFYSGRMIKQHGQFKYAHVEFIAPKNHQSLAIQSSHKLAAHGQKWTGSTEAKR